MKKIAFHSNQLGIRGTEVALYDYALYNETILGNKSYIISSKNKDLSTLKKFQDRFEVFLYDRFEESFEFVYKNNIEYVYYQKAGENDGLLVPNVKNIVHAVFQRSEPHGDKYAYISKWLANKMESDVYVPYVVDLPQPNDFSLKDKLGIPQNATVIGRHGGYTEFDLPYVHQAVIEAVEKRDDLYFVFMNTRPFYTHKNIIYIEGTYDLQNKSNYICMCDAMIHARNHGESFGLAISEFLFLDKPVIASIHGLDQAHRTLLKDLGMWYSNAEECLFHLLNFKTEMRTVGCYKNLVAEYTPKNVMDQFNKVFLS